MGDERLVTNSVMDWLRGEQVKARNEGTEVGTDRAVMFALVVQEIQEAAAEIERLRPLLGLVQGIRNYVDGRGGMLARDIAEMIDMAEGMKA